MKFYCVFIINAALIVTFCFSVVFCKKNGKKKNGKNENSGRVVPEMLSNVFDNTTRYSVSQNVRSKKVSCTKENINDMVKSVRCKPRLTVVSLVSGSKSKFVPNAVLAKRCSGSCDGFQRCLPTKSTNTTFFVKEIIKNKTYCSAVEVFEDKECACECLLKPKDCSAYQRYSFSTCTCRCNDDAEFRKCKNSMSKNFEWNERKCSCECVGTCPDDFEWDSNKCRCNKLGG